MTKKERAYIEAQIQKFEQWARQEYDSAYSSADDPDEVELQARLCDASASALRNLLIDLQEGV